MKLTSRPFSNQTRLPLGRVRTAALYVATALLFGSTLTAQSDTIQVSPIVCLSGFEVLEWEADSDLSTYSFLQVQLRRPGRPSIRLPGTPSTDQGVARFDWSVASDLPEASDYRLTALYIRGQGIFAQRRIFTSPSFEIQNCRPNSTLLRTLEKQLSLIDRLLWEDWTGRRVPDFPPDPLCLSCPRYGVNTSDLLAAFDNSGLQQTVVATVKDRRGRRVGSPLRFVPDPRGFSKLNRYSEQPVSMPVAYGSHCGLTLEVSDSRGRRLAKSSICLDVGK